MGGVEGKMTEAGSNYGGYYEPSSSKKIDLATLTPAQITTGITRGGVLQVKPIRYAGAAGGAYLTNDDLEWEKVRRESSGGDSVSMTSSIGAPAASLDPGFTGIPPAVGLLPGAARISAPTLSTPASHGMNLGAFGLGLALPSTGAGGGGAGTGTGAGGGGGGSADAGGGSAAPQLLTGFGLPDVPLIAAAAVAPVPVPTGTGSITLTPDEQNALVTAIDRRLASPAGRLAVGLIDSTFQISNIVAFSRAVAPVAKSVYTAARGAYTKTSFYTALLTRWVAEKLEKQDETIMSTIATSSGLIRKLEYYKYDHAGLREIILSAIADPTLKNLALKALNAGKEAHVATYNMIRSYILLQQKYGIVGATQQSKNILTALTEAGSTTVEECNLLRDFFIYVYTIRVKQQLRNAFYAEYTSNPQIYDMIIQGSESNRFMKALDSILSMAGVKILNPRPIDPSRSASVTEGGSKPIIRITAREQMSVNAIVASILEDTDTECTNIPGVADLKALIRTILVINEGAVPVINPAQLAAAATLYSQIKTSYVRSTGNAGMFGMRGPNIGAAVALTGETSRKRALQAENAAVAASGGPLSSAYLAGLAASSIVGGPSAAARSALHTISGAGTTAISAAKKLRTNVAEGWRAGPGPFAVGDITGVIGGIVRIGRTGSKYVWRGITSAADLTGDVLLLLVALVEKGYITLDQINTRYGPTVREAVASTLTVARTTLSDMFRADPAAAAALGAAAVDVIRDIRGSDEDAAVNGWGGVGGRMGGGARSSRRYRNRKTHKQQSIYNHKNHGRRVRFSRKARITRKTRSANHH